MVHKPFKGKNLLLGGRHCERTMFFFFGSLFAFVFFGALVISDNFDINLGSLTSTDNETGEIRFEIIIGPVEFVIGLGIFTLAGYLGVVYYRYEHEPRKKPVFLWKFWKAEK